MKKAILVLALIPLLLTATAQNTSPYWSLVGNSNAASTSKLGTTNGIPLRIMTNNTERIRIATDGKVGIGTTSPQQRLHVEGSSNHAIFVSTSALGLTSGSGVAGYVKALPTAAGQRLGYFSFGSRGGAQYSYTAAGMVGYAEAGWAAGSSHPAYLAFEVTPYGSTSRKERLRITASGNVGIGTTSPFAMLQVVDTTGNYGIHTKSEYIGTYSDGASHGVYGYSSYGNGVTGQSIDYIGVTGSSTTYSGVVGNSIEGFGGRFTSYNDVGLQATTTNGFYAGAFYGNVYSSGMYEGSDKNLKKNIQDFTGAMDIINKLKPKNYEFRSDGKFASLRLPKGTHYGLIAQELEEVLPNLVKETPHQLGTGTLEAANKPGDDGKPALLKTPQKETTETMTFKAVNYMELVPVLIKGLQEQDQRMQELSEKDKQIDELNARISKLEDLVSRLTGRQPTLTVSSTTLAQNTPNPAKGATRISYSLPLGTSKAQLLLTDALGRAIKTMEVNASGLVDVDASAFSSGVYNYSLIVDGKTVQTRKMTVIK